MWGPIVGPGGNPFYGSGSRLPLVADRTVEDGLLGLSAPWFMPGENEVGGQPGRGCRRKAVEHHGPSLFMSFYLVRLNTSMSMMATDNLTGRS